MNLSWRSGSGLVLGLVGASVVACAAPPEVMAPTGLAPERQRLQLESFDLVWRTVRDKHWDPGLHGLDWDQARADFEPRVRSATTDDEARTAMSELLARLGQSHFAVIPGNLYGAESNADARGGSGETGLEFRLVGGEPLVTRVRSEEARSLGIRPGWVLTSIGAIQVGDVLSTPFHHATIPEDMLRIEALESHLSGDVGDRIQVAFRDGDDQARRIDLPVVARQGTIAQFGNLPATAVRFESRTLDGDVGYIAFNMFLEPAVVSAGFDAAVSEFMGRKGLIIDLRGNPGGLGIMAMGMAGWLVDTPGLELGTMTARELKLRFVIVPRPETYRGPVAVLVDSFSASTSEIFAAGVQDLGRARIFGTRTAGAALPSLIETLPNGDRFQYAFAHYVSQSGRVLEGNGVTPDVEVHPTRAALLAGEDPILAAAVAWLRSSNAGGSAPATPDRN